MKKPIKPKPGVKSKMIYRFISFILLFLLGVQTNAHLYGQCIDPDLICDTCPCIAMYFPVIGCDGEIYGNSCEAQNSGVVYYLSYLDIVSIEGPSELFKGDSVVLYVQHTDVDPSFISYEWNNGDTGREITVWPDSSFEYSVHITVVYSFENGSSFVEEGVFNKMLNVRQEYNDAGMLIMSPEVKIYPVPADRLVQVFSDQEIDYLQLIDIKGGIVQYLNVDSRNTVIDVSNLSPGIYIAKVHCKGLVMARKITVE